MKIRREYLMPTLVLGIICLVVAALLAAVNLLTLPVIEANDEEKVARSYVDAFGESAVVSFNDKRDITEDVRAKNGGTLPDALDRVIAEDNGNGYAVVITTKSKFSKGTLSVTLGVGSDGKIVDMAVTSYFESRNIRGADGKVAGYVGADLGYLSGEGKADVLVSGATFSSTAFRDAVTAALEALNNYIGGDAS